MARNMQPILKRCRTLGIEPAVMGVHKSSKKNPNKSRKKQSEYGLQLNEKQKVKFIYGVLEKPFRKYYVMATKKHGITGEELLSILETRLDNVVFRLGLANTRREARQIVNHGHILVNGNKVDISGFGKFEVKTRAERTGINPATKETIQIPASKAPGFKAAKALKEAVK